MRSAVLAVLVLIALPAVAGDYVADGHPYRLRCTASGYELTSRYPITREVGAGAGRNQVTAREKLYLGSSCDAANKVFGKGSWCWANGGFTARFPSHELNFSGQELFCGGPRDYETNCGCS